MIMKVRFCDNLLSRSPSSIKIFLFQMRILSHLIARCQRQTDDDSTGVVLREVPGCRRMNPGMAQHTNRY